MAMMVIKAIRPRKSATFHITPKHAKRAKGLTPETWDCVDCGRNTAHRVPDRSAMLRNIKRFGVIFFNDAAPTEIYTVHDAVWKRARMKPYGGCLCIGCLERRIKRRLKPSDFAFGHVFNTLPGTARRLDRRGELDAWSDLLRTEKGRGKRVSLPKKGSQ